MKFMSNVSILKNNVFEIFFLCCIEKSWGISKIQKVLQFNQKFVICKYVETSPHDYTPLNKF